MNIYKLVIYNFLRNCVKSGLRVEHIIKEATDKMIEHVGRETIQVKQLPNIFKLSVKVYIGGAKVKNSVQ